jgi:hypothetical protein
MKTASRVLNRGTRCKRAIGFTPSCFVLSGKSPLVPIGEEAESAPRPGMKALVKYSVPASPSFSVVHPEAESLYRLRVYFE